MDETENQINNLEPKKAKNNHGGIWYLHFVLGFSVNLKLP